MTPFAVLNVCSCAKVVVSPCAVQSDHPGGSQWCKCKPVVNSHSSTSAEDAAAQLRAAKRYDSLERHITEGSAEWVV